MEKNYGNSHDRGYFIEIHSVGQKMHEEEDVCVDGCKVKTFLETLDKTIIEMEAEETNFQQRMKFIELAKDNVKLFLIFDQLLKKFGAEFFHLESYDFQMAVSFEIEKVKNYFKNLDKIKLLQAKNLVIEKTFL